MVDEIKIGNIVVKRGTKKKGYLDVMQTPTRTIQIPVAIVNGTMDGPVLTLLAGDYGRDYNGFIAISDLFNRIRCSSLSGQLIMIPFLNLPALEEKADFSSIDLRSPNLNRCFPGDPDGSPNMRLVNRVVSDVISKSNYFILLEAGGGTEHHINTVSFTTIGNPEVDTKSEEIAKHFITAEYLYKREIDPHTNPPTNFQTGVASLEIPTITADVGGETGEIDEKAVNRFVKGVLNVMKHLTMIKGEAEEVVQKRLLERFRIKANKAGIFRPRVKAGEIVEKNQVLGKILNVQGDILEELKSPADGVVYVVLCTGPMHRMLPTVIPGNNVIDIANIY